MHADLAFWSLMLVIGIYLMVSGFQGLVLKDMRKSEKDFQEAGRAENIRRRVKVHYEFWMKERYNSYER